MAKEKNTKKGCTTSILAVRDALDIIGGKWKIPILMAIVAGNHRFKDILEAIPKLSAKVLSSELKFLEENRLLTKNFDEDTSVTQYFLTEHTKTLRNVADALEEWGKTHRKVILEK